MGAITIKSTFQAGEVWHVDYVEAMDCGCGFKPRTTVTLKQSKKPTQKQVENAINKSRGQDVQL